MRLFLIPISTKRTLIYGQRLNKVTQETPTLADKASARAAQLWLKWESAEKGWQKKLTEYGNKVFNRIAFEEWGLKSIPPLSARKEQEGAASKKIEVIFPPSIISEQNVPKIVERLATERTSLHRRRLIWCLIGMPISAPFGLIPVIPNIPFFYLAYRAFSHWKALSGAKHLEFLSNRTLILPVKSAALDAVYRRHNTDTAIDDDALVNKEKVEWTEVAKAIRSARKGDEGHKEVLLLREEDAEAVAKVANVPALAVECERASRQVAEQMQLRAEEDAQKIH
ncbi:mitochondrial K+-H+ exchange-related-domain-containing protein [Sphaerosporella brunnea]|uniref:Mitochondrial K+-H+ exchange-related-domain-containing protein n=1 Tax=Sphaerosporella brunnea TaxID=1250544 RepID=A0A5J5EV26_9PEZI|nr:mitochondrial K+-H+ exchange-related-domain-containing protein [Sphaerosporella brunnea]